ncbi:unnamed protein product [Peronospora destructor]|uniref:Uncharacterized protein n=1 Tax=Peronospora destructor TaxID=86335 RepID=A0AAV0TQX4_9STRA|nr:unnamed protein product [Peronospora destructor]
MGKTSKRQMFTSTSSNSSLRYRRKASVPTNKEQQQSTDSKQDECKQLKQKLLRGERPPAGFRFRSKSRNAKQQQQPVLLKQLLWKAKAVQPTVLTVTRQLSKCKEDEEVVCVNGVEALDTAKRNTVGALKPSSSESFVAGSSSQETQSGSEDDVVFLRYSDLRPAVQPSTKWRMDKEQREDAEEIGGENWPVMPSQEEVVKKQAGLEETVATRRKAKQKYRLKQEQKRAAAKGHKRLQKRQENERLPATKEDTESITQDGENAAEGNFHPSTNLRSEMDTGLSQLKKVVPFIVVGDVACPVVADLDNELGGTAASASDQSMASITVSKVAIVDFRQHGKTLLDRSKETQVQDRDSFVVEDSAFDAASSYDFFKRRFYEIQRTTGIVYY